jgi:hypothetical protein
LFSGGEANVIADHRLPFARPRLVAFRAAFRPAFISAPNHVESRCQLPRLLPPIWGFIRTILLIRILSSYRIACDDGDLVIA